MTRWMKLTASMLAVVVAGLGHGWAEAETAEDVEKPSKKADASAEAKAPDPSRAQIQDMPGLPRVLLIGDSISLGYTLDVRKLLEGKANVHRPPANCGSTRTGLKNIDAWLGDGKWDVIHFNWGLWDINRTVNGKRNMEGEITMSEEEYGQNLETLVLRLKETHATLIWASTTYVQGGFGRRPGDEIRYNAVARAIMDKHGVKTNDLHALSATFPIYGTSTEGPEMFKSKGNVHFTAEGSAVLAKQVAASIEEAIGTKSQAQ